MNARKTWLIALTAALAGAAVTHVSWLLREERPAQPVSDRTCAPEIEHVCPGGDAMLAAPRVGKPAAPIRSEPEPVATPPQIAAPAAGWNPVAQLAPEQRKIMVRQRYGAVMRELALSPSQIERLTIVLSEWEARGPFGAHAGAGSQDAQAAAERERAEIAAVIGSEKAAAFEHAKQMLPLRYEVRRVRDELEETGEPITAEQYRALTAAMTAAGPEPPPGPAEGQSWEEAAELHRDWMTEIEDSFRERAAKILSPAQLKALDESRELRDAMRSQFEAAHEARREQTRSGG